MPFILTELVVESVIREGLSDMRASIGTPQDQIEDIFGTLKSSYLEKEYGDKAISKIKSLILEEKKPISIVQGFPLEDIKPPLISINLMNDTESEQVASMDDFMGEVDVAIDPEVYINTFTADSYDVLTGIVVVDLAGLDLSNIAKGSVFVDGNGKSFSIISVTNTANNKRFTIEKGQTINLVGCRITSPVVSSRSIQRGIRNAEMIILRIITENPLFTKYLYKIVKYILVSRKVDLINRGVGIDTFEGSDFSRMDHLPSNPYERVFTLKTRVIEHTWNAEKVVLIQNIVGSNNSAAVKVKRDLYKRDDEETLTVQTVIDN